MEISNYSLSLFLCVSQLLNARGYLVVKGAGARETSLVSELKTPSVIMVEERTVHYLALRTHLVDAVE